MSEEALQRLTQIFESLGANDPAGWASSQINEGIPQLHRFLFLREAYKNIVLDEEDLGVVDRLIATTPVGDTAPYAAQGHALRSLIEKGATRQELVDLMRCVQVEALFGFCYLLEGNMSDDSESVQWALLALDEDDEPVAGIPGLYESVLEMDPTGREMRPRE